MTAIKMTLQGDIPQTWIEHFKSLSNDEERIAITRKIAGVLMQDTEDAFAAETSPQGEKWQPLNPAYKAQRHKANYTGKMLQKTGVMAASLNTQYTATQAQISAASPYALYHQYGTKRMPARQFLGLSPIGFDEIHAIFNRVFSK